MRLLKPIHAFAVVTLALLSLSMVYTQTSTDSKSVPPISTIPIISSLIPVSTAIPTSTSTPIQVSGAIASTTQTPSVIESQDLTFDGLMLSLLVEAISVFVFGVIVARALANQQRSFEARQSERVSCESQTKYLINIRKEIEANLIPLRPLAFDALIPEDQKINFYIKLVLFGNPEDRLGSAKDFFRNPIFKTTYWDALVPSGLLPSLADVDTLALIADFYHNLRTLRADITLLIDRQYDEAKTADKYSRLIKSIVGDPNEELLRQRIMPNVSATAKLGDQLLNRLGKTIEDLKKEVDPSIGNKEYLDHSFLKLRIIDELPSLETFQDVRIVGINRKKIYRLDTNQERFSFHIDLLPFPSLDWIQEFGLMSLKLWSELTGSPECKIKSDYLLFFGTAEELKVNYARIKSAVENTNLRYRSKLQQVEDALTEEAEIRNAVVKSLNEFLDDLDSSFT